MQVSIYRYNPDQEAPPSMQTLSIDLPEGKDLMVLEVLEMLKAEDPSLTFRRFRRWQSGTNSSSGRCPGYR